MPGYLLGLGCNGTYGRLEVAEAISGSIYRDEAATQSEEVEINDGKQRIVEGPPFGTPCHRNEINSMGYVSGTKNEEEVKRSCDTQLCRAACILLQKDRGPVPRARSSVRLLACFCMPSVVLHTL